LHILTDAGTGVLLTVHPSKGNQRGEFDARGTGAIAAFADVLVNLNGRTITWTATASGS